MKILVTGANGFVGSAFCTRLLQEGISVHAATRLPTTVLPSASQLKQYVVGELDGKTDWMPALEDVEVVVHLAARVHMMKDRVPDPLREFLKVNLEATVNLARQAAQAGVRRFVYLSSIKVNGESSTAATPFRETDPPNPLDSYAVSKLRAEEALQMISGDTGMEVVIIRPPLVYGPGVKANFAKLMRLVDKGIPLPLGCVANKRSFIYLGNLCDALLHSAVHPRAAGHVFLVSDGENSSSAELVRKVAQALHRPARLIPVPVSLMRFMGNLLGKSAAIDRLTQSLVLDTSKINTELGWTPPFTMTEGLEVTAAWYLTSRT